MKLTTELYDYQSQAVDKLMRVKVGALYMEMGTGKTRTALELIQRRLQAGKVCQVLWLCPYSVSRDLPELLSEHAEGAENIIRVAGIESLSNSTRIYDQLLRYVCSAPTFLVIDESLLVKNPFARRTERITRISKACIYKLILNGTPISRNAADLFAQWYILDWRILGYKSYYSFAANHLEMDPDRPGRIVRVLNTEYLARKIAPYTFQCSKGDVLSLPKKILDDYDFAMTDDQFEHYIDVADKMILQIDECRPDTIYRMFGALQAIASGFKVTISKDGKHNTLTPFFESPDNNPRLQTLINRLNMIGDERVVIYCRYTREIDDICATLGNSAVAFDGRMSVKARQAAKTAFKRGEKQYFVANKTCAQFGLNLQFARNEIFFNNDWDWGTRAQAEDRVHRAGQTQDVYIWDIYARGTLDVTILDCLSKKERLSDRIKNEIASHNDVRETIKAMAYGQLEDDTNGKNLHTEKCV